jgi:hypothetical protein
MNDTRCTTSVARELPATPTPMVTLDDVSEAIDQYRGDYNDRLLLPGTPDTKHADAKATVLAELSEAADEPVWRPVEYDRKPVQDDLLGATWPSGPLSVDELRQAHELGIDTGEIGDPDRWPVKWALIRQEIARRETGS